MPTYIVTIEDRIACAGKVQINAANAAEAALIAKNMAEDGEVPMTPMENGEDRPYVYQISDAYGDEIATLGDDIGDDPNSRCLADHLDKLLELEGIDSYEFDEDLLSPIY